MRTKTILLVLAMAGCTDAPMTWRDAAAIWGRSWCAVDKRCDPRGFSQDFADDSACEELLVLENCSPRLHGCAQPYTRPSSGLDACLADMEVAGCSDPLPASCLAALAP